MKLRFKAKVKIKKGDKVVVITGEHKDLNSPKTVTAVYSNQNKVLVEGVNLKTKHLKPTAQNTKGSITKKEAPIHISNVLLWDGKAGSGSRITRSTNENGKKIRISKKSGEVI